MTGKLERLGVQESVEAIFPPSELAAFLSDLPIDVSVVDEAGIADCDAVVTRNHFDALFEVDWIHSTQAGVDRFPLEALAEDGVALTNSTGIHGRTVGETVAGYLLAFARRLHDQIASATERRWERPAWDEAFTLPGTTACVVGTGTLGRGVADVLGSLGVETVGVRRSDDPLPEFDEMYAIEALHEPIATADFVIVTVPLTEATRGLFAATEFDAMRSDAYFVNVARGAVVDERALIDALEAGDIAGAALDVFETEPLPETSPLWELDDVIVTPHAAAYTRDYFRDVGGIVRENVERIGRGDDLTNRVV
ncbi:D-2-hydroxyacid dehydrogenase [Natronorubrum texcoconense]|uniref:D-2-hydroxyacid dehydrogenase (NADP+) n=1 Tax=Natronorubrum texcoconense TaxID=1095776 RepID=A0A1G9DED7_9EURY|nr:D-2-hydroxyacid dehydrogenase [Natronorubrum texcoconense]SDK62251.1 D-2-hydroxyacid dehydrogenase (NADP+) [Natronorubrum texcoconense]